MAAMRFRATIIAFLLLLILGGAVYWFEIRGAEKREELKSREDRVFSLDFLTLDSLLIEREGKGKVKLDRTGPETWEIVEPVRTEADNGAVKSLSNRLQALEYQRVVDPAPEDLAKYGLVHPEIRVEVEGGGKSEALLVGNRGPIGNTLYLKKASAPEVLLIDSTFYSTVNKGLLDLRERRIIRFERHQVNGIRLTYPDREIKLDRRDLKWRIQEPGDYPADQGQVDRILTELINLKADEIVTEKLTDPSSYGLDRPRLELELELKEEGKASFLIGRKKKGGLYAYRNGGDPVYLIKPEVLAHLTKDVNDLRDKLVVKFDRYDVTAVEFARPQTTTVRFEKFENEAGDESWKAVSPREGEIDRSQLGKIFTELRRLQALEFIDPPSGLQPYGLDKPWLQINLRGQENQLITSLQMGKEAEGELSFVKTEADPVYKVESKQVAVLVKLLQDIFESD